ncbi:MAG: M48 family peptidase, partial [Cyclobacteriaceae bacterium]|nr:M48 family peptidase [Cyclobacteriaceae bacterium]
MKKSVVTFFTFIILIGCATVPITGRKQLSLIPNSQILPYSYASYQDVLKESKLSNNQQEVTMVKTIGVKIQHAVEKFMAENKMSDELEGYNWEFNLIED